MVEHVKKRRMYMTVEITKDTHFGCPLNNLCRGV